VQEWVALELLLLLEKINKARPHILLLLGRGFWDLLDSLAVADKCIGVVVLVLANAFGILVDSFSVHPPVADERSRVIVLLLENVIGILSGLLEKVAVVVHAGLGDGHVDVGGRHIIF